MSTILVWEITPSINHDFDTYVIPVSEDPEAQKALKIAQDTLEHLWDTWDDLNDLDIRVRLRRSSADSDEIEEL